MAKKSKKCGDPQCIECRWWPAMAKLVGKAGGCYWVDETTGELFVATGLRATPNGSAVPIPEEESPSFWETECTCGFTMIAREDLMRRGLTRMCPSCAASLTHTMRN